MDILSFGAGGFRMPGALNFGQQKGAGAPWQATLTKVRDYLAANDGAVNPHSSATYSPSPTVVVSTGNNLAPAAPYTNLTAFKTYLNNDPVFRYWGGGNKPVTVGSITARRFPSSYNAPTAGNVGDNEGANTWRVAFRHTGQSIAFRIDGSDLTVFNAYRLIVDGMYVSVPEPTMPAGGRRWLVIDFGSTATRTLILEGASAALFWGVAAAPLDTVEPVPESPIRALMLGDSFTDRTGADWSGNGLSQVAADYLRISDWWGSGVGGTGYLNTASNTKPRLFDRLDEDLLRFTALGRADIIVVAMGLNDLSLGSVTDQANACFDYIRANAPGALIFVLGPWDVEAPNPPSFSGYALRKAEIVSAVGSRGGFYFLDPQGVAFTKAGGGDNTHPNTAGHLVLGQWLNGQIRAKVAA